MKFKSVTTIMTLVLAAGSLVLTPVSADSERSGGLHITKNCNNAPSLHYCTITSSNLGEIPPGSKVLYTQGGPTAGPMTADIAFDSLVVLFVGFGDWAVGRCALDSRQYAGNYGLCTFSNGVGRLAGFTASVNVSPFENTPTDVDYFWNGTYSFRPTD